MLAQRLSLSLPTIKPSGEWSPDDEATLEAWYQNRTGLSLTGGLSPLVTDWADSSPNGHDMTQGTATERPEYTSIGGILTFDQAKTQNLQTASQISLTGDFTIGIRINPSTPIADAGSFVADNTTVKELFKYQSNSRITVKIDLSGATNLDLDSGTFGDDYIVITRVSDVLTLWRNGTAQTGTTPTLEGTADIDAIGIRATNADAFDGTIQEIQIYSSSSAALTSHINDRLSTL